MKQRSILFEILLTLSVTFAAYALPLGLLWLNLGGR